MRWMSPSSATSSTPALRTSPRPIMAKTKSWTAPSRRMRRSVTEPSASSSASPNKANATTGVAWRGAPAAGAPVVDRPADWHGAGQRPQDGSPGVAQVAVGAEARDREIERQLVHHRADQPDEEHRGEQDGQERDGQRAQERE